MNAILYLSCLLLTLTINVSASQNETTLKTESNSKPIASNYKNDPNECIMLIHGFGGSTIDFKPLTDIFDSLGVNYYALMLSGHGTKPEDLKDVKHEVWLAESFNAFDSLALEYDRVSLIGFSMGGAISLIIASERDVHRLTVLSPYFETHKKWYYFGKPEVWAARFAKVFPYIRKLKIGQISDPKGLETYTAYRKIPLKAVAELSEIGKIALSQVEDISCPILWMHSTNDIVADFILSKESFERTKSDEKRFIEFSESNHIILYDYDADVSIHAIQRFMNVIVSY